MNCVLKTMLAVAAVCAATPPASAWADDHDGPFGAIAYSQTHDNSYFVTDYPTQADAEAAALADCKNDDPSDTTCTIPLTFQNACGAFAKAGDGAWGTGWGATQDLADQWAVDTCRQYGGTDCKTKMIVCSPGGAMTAPAD